MIKKPIIILYVKDQTASKDFYKIILKKDPVLDVPGMTEFELTADVLLGLMPESSIKKILENKTPDPASGSGIPRCELYLPFNDPQSELNLALINGAKLISPLSWRSWGDEVAYCSDPDGHIIAFAR
ncbi:MAG: hypothetical protein ACXVNM_00680 [Bacteroidia bacterium]